MGIGIVLIAWAIVGTILAAIAALIFATTVYLVTGPVPRKQRMAALLAVTIFPFLGLGWAAANFAFEAVVNETFLHRDPGLGDAWQCPLPNGYAILMIDETDQGMVFNPKTQLMGDGDVAIGADDPDAVGGVRKLQVAGKYILGGADSKSFGAHKARDRIDGYFLLNTQARTRANFSNYDSLRAAAESLGIQPNLEPIEAVYSHYRFTWFDIFAGILFVIPPLLGALVLFVWIHRLRNAPASC